MKRKAVELLGEERVLFGGVFLEADVWRGGVEEEVFEEVVVLSLDEGDHHFVGVLGELDVFVCSRDATGLGLELGAEPLGFVFVGVARGEDVEALLDLLVEGREVQEVSAEGEEVFGGEVLLSREYPGAFDGPGEQVHVELVHHAQHLFADDLQSAFEDVVSDSFVGLQVCQLHAIAIYAPIL